MAALAPELEALGADTTAEEIDGVLKALFDSDHVNHPEIAEKLKDEGYDSLAVLRNLSREGLREMGFNSGRRDLIMAVVHKGGAATLQLATGHPLGAAEHAGRSGKPAKIGSFPDLTATGYPSRPGYAAYEPRVIAAVRQDLGQHYSDLVKEGLEKQVRPSEAELPAASEANARIWKLVIESGDGIPDRLMLMFSREIRQGELGIESLLFLKAGVYATGDGAAEIVSQWLDNPPVVPQGESHLHKCEQLLLSWKEQLERAKELDVGGSEVSQRLSLKKMFANVKEIQEAWSSLDNAHNDSPPLKEVLKMLERKATKFAAAFQEKRNSTALSAVGGTAYGIDKKGNCWWWSQGRCSKGAACPHPHGDQDVFSDASDRIDGVQIPKPKERTDAQMQAWLMRSLQGISDSVGLPVWLVMALCAIGQMGSVSWDCARRVTEKALACGVVADTGATVKGIGRKHMGSVRNKRSLDNPIDVATASGGIQLTEGADLPVGLGMMDGAAVLPESDDSLLPVVPTCEDDDLGFDIAQGGGKAGFYRSTGERCSECGRADREVVIELTKEGQLFTLPVVDAMVDGSGRDTVGVENGPGNADIYYDCELITNSMLRKRKRGSKGGVRQRRKREKEEKEKKKVERQKKKLTANERRAEHEEVVAGLHCCYGASQKKVAGVPNVWKVSKELREHRKTHRPARPDICPDCKQALMKEKKAERGDRDQDTSKDAPVEWEVDGDLTGPHEPDVDGHQWASVNVERNIGYADVGLQDTKGSSEVLESVLEMERQLKAESKREGRIVSFHHDDDKAYRGEFEKRARKEGWKDTHTGGHRPSTNAVCERRIGMLNQLFRVLLLGCTGGLYYYEQLWGPGLRHANYILNRRPWKRLQGWSPVGWLRGEKILKLDRNLHVFGAYCMWKVSGKQKSGKWQPNSEKGIWVGLNPDVVGGHLVIPIKWNPKNRCWDLMPTVTATTVHVYDDVFPLKMTAPCDKKKAKFEEFVEAVFDPLTSDSAPEPVDAEDEEYEVEKIVRKRGKGDSLEYLVKYQGYTNRHNRWLSATELEDCASLILEFEERQKEAQQRKAKGVQGRRGRPARVSTQHFAKLMSLIVTMAAVEAAGSGERRRLPELDVRAAVEQCVRKQPGLTGGVEDYVDGYEKEIDHMLRRRLRLLEPEEAKRVKAAHQTVSMRMNLEDKRDDRHKGRLILQGCKEPDEWDVESNESPVTLLSTVRTMVFANDEVEDDSGYDSGDENDERGERGDEEVLSTIDISVAFLQSEEYGPNEKPRYVTFRPVRGGREYVFQLLGPVYGQRSAPRAFNKTLVEYLVKEAGYVQAKNDPCLFRHPITKHKVATVVDDLLCRGRREVSAQFFIKLMERFDCKDPSFLEVGTQIDFCGLNMRSWMHGGVNWYSLDQESELLNFLEDCDLEDCVERECPMPTKSLLVSDESELSESERKWCRRVMGKMHHFARGTRWDISQVASRISQRNQNPDGGTVKAIRHAAGYLKATAGHRICGARGKGKDKWEYWTDSDHNGDRELVKGSRSGLLIKLNGVPVHWRSTVQKAPAISPAEAEIYALSEGLRDARQVTDVAEEFGSAVERPIVISVDNDQACAFSDESCVRSRLRGCFDYREDWVQELRNRNVVRTENIDSEENLADFFTKCFSKKSYLRLRRLIMW